MAEEKIFADGFVFKRNENAPDFVVGRVSVKVDEAIAFLKQHESNGWVNLGVKTARSGNYYMDLDTFQANDSSKKEGEVDKYEAKSKAVAEDPADDLPF